jgi:hypothetical protein
MTELHQLALSPGSTRGSALIEVGPAEGHDQSFADMIERLFRQFEAELPLTAIVRVVRESRRQLSGSPAGAMPELTERLAIERLTTLALAGLKPTELSQPRPRESAT